MPLHIVAFSKICMECVVTFCKIFSAINSHKYTLGKIKSIKNIKINPLYLNLFYV